MGLPQREELISIEDSLRVDLNQVMCDTTVTTKLSTDDVERRLESGAKDPIQPGERERRKQESRRKAVHEMRDLFTQVVIRRRSNSKDPDGNLIHGLPPLTKHVFYLDMTPEEDKVLQAIRKDVAPEL